VEDGRGRLGMELGQCHGGLVRDPQASGQGDVPSVATVNEMEQRAVRDELVHQHGDQAAAEELDDVLVVDLRQDQHLPAELLLLLVDGHAPLHGHLYVVALLNSFPVADHLSLIEHVCGLLQLFFGEYLERGAAFL
jgi:hypothetical protein